MYRKKKRFYSYEHVIPKTTKPCAVPFLRNAMKIGNKIAIFK